uniref:Uncharacterized protein n=1 Tax=Chelonoidis abingdonii TaxID=106734 RepID=A0A8C0G7H1_CHEAB
MIRTPLPRQEILALLMKKYKTYPLHELQRTFLLSCSLVVFPLYRSSKDTLENKVFHGCIISSPLLLPLRLLL